VAYADLMLIRLVAEPDHERRLFVGPQLRCSERPLGPPGVVHDDAELATAAPVAGGQGGDVDAGVGKGTGHFREDAGLGL